MFPKHMIDQSALVSGTVPFLYRFEASLEVAPIGIVPEGLRLAVGFEGRIVEGLLSGARVSGVDHLLIRRDGVGVVDAHKTISLDGLNVYEHVQAYCLPPEGMALPPLEALVRPDFVWPEALFPVRGFSTFRAAHAEVEYLNRVIASIEGEASFATGRLRVETRLPPRVPIGPFAERLAA